MSDVFFARRKTMDINETYLCLLDNLDPDTNVTLDEFTIRTLTTDEVAELVCLQRGRCHVNRCRRGLYPDYPWAILQTTQHPPTPFAAALLRFGLAYAHAGTPSWFPFGDLIRTINLLKQATGPVIPRYFYHRLCSNTGVPSHEEAAEDGEPYSVHCAGDDGTVQRIALSEYTLSSRDESRFHELRQQLACCMASQGSSRFQIAVHYFENADRRLVPQVFPGSFNAIDPLMSYEACLEAMLIREIERGDTSNRLSKRIRGIAGLDSQECGEFVRRVFWLRSKAAHSTRSVSDIERLIVTHPNDAIDERQPIPPGPYDHLLLGSTYFPGFLVNFREMCRRCILHFSQEHANGQDQDATLQQLDQ